MKKLILVVILMLVMAIPIYSQVTEQEKLLTEISVDVKYIKSNIKEINEDFKIIQEQVNCLDRRLIQVESKTNNLEKVIYNLENINKWFLGILATLVGGLILYQYNRAGRIRKDDRA